MEIQQGMISVILVFLLSACATPAVKTQALVPAKSLDAARMRQVAVLPFDGPGGRQFAAEVEGTLAGITIDDKQYFSVIDRVTLDKVLAEHKLQLSGAIDPATATQFGKLVGAKGIYTGGITVSKSEDSHYQEERSRCAESDKKGKCIRTETYRVPCTKRSATFSFTPKLIEVETGRIVYANNITGSASASACQGEKPLPNWSDLIETAKGSAKGTLMNDVAPSYATFAINLMDSTEGINSKEGEKKFKAGLEFAKGNRFDRACEIWGEARILAPDSPSIIYDLGVCAETSGDLEQALELYKKSDRLLNKPDDRITTALRRATSAIQNQKRLNEQR